MEPRARRLLEAVFGAGLAAVDPETAVQKHVSRHGNRLRIGDCSYDLSAPGRVILVGAGKATAPMARALEDILDDRLDESCIIVKHGHGVPLRKTVIIEAGHPLPDEAGVRGAEALLERVAPCGENDLVLGAFSGGGSALLPSPAPPISLGEKQEATRRLLECGATIQEINAVRKHLSRIKGGGLARAAHPAALVALLLSDVVGDPPEVIASGPTVPDASTFGDCLDIIERYRLKGKLPGAVEERLEQGAQGLVPETPKAADAFFRRVQNIVVGSNRAALLAAQDQARASGYTPIILSSQVEGEAREVAKVLAAVGKKIREAGFPVAPPACVLAGGETTVTLRGSGKGGRNQELALAAAIALDGFEGIRLLSAGTDGTDGPTDAAGAFADGSTCRRARKAGMDPHAFLAHNDAYPFFQTLGDLLVTGPTRTNVMDLIALLVEARPTGKSWEAGTLGGRGAS